MISAHAVTAISTSFLASVVEVTEAYSIVLAVGLSRGWRSAILGTAGALAVLALCVMAFGPLLATIPLKDIQAPLGLLLLVFGMGWLRKAILRGGGVIPLHDEDLIFAKQMKILGVGERPGSIDTVGMLTAFQGVLLEGLEVVFIVIAVGVGRNMLVPASAGALLACFAVLSLGAVIHKPLSRVPENTLKFAVGVMLTSFGIFWIGEALGVAWPGADFALAYIAGVFLLSGVAAASYLKRTTA